MGRLKLTEAEACLQNLLGNESLDPFRAQMDDLKCYSKALALTDLKSETDEIKEKLATICQAILAEAMAIFLRRDYSDDEGSVEINMGKKRIYDKNMNLILPLKGLQDNQEQIVSAMMSVVFPIFKRGRELALRIVQRRRLYLESQVIQRSLPTIKVQAIRDYEKFPPRELLSIEMMRLEQKLPNLSPEEGLRLSHLYQHA